MNQYKLLIIISKAKHSKDKPKTLVRNIQKIIILIIHIKQINDFWNSLIDIFLEIFYWNDKRIRYLYSFIERIPWWLVLRLKKKSSLRTSGYIHRKVSLECCLFWRRHSTMLSCSCLIYAKELECLFFL